MQSFSCPYYGWDIIESIKILKYFMKKYFNQVLCDYCLKWSNITQICKDTKLHCEEYDYFETDIKCPNKNLLEKLKNKLNTEYNNLFKLYILPKSYYYSRDHKTIIFIIDVLQYSADQNSCELEELTLTNISQNIINELGTPPKLWVGLTHNGYFL